MKLPLDEYLPDPTGNMFDVSPNGRCYRMWKWASFGAGTVETGTVLIVEVEVGFVLKGP